MMQIVGTDVLFKSTLLLCLSRYKHGLGPKQKAIHNKIKCFPSMSACHHSGT